MVTYIRLIFDTFRNSATHLSSKRMSSITIEQNIYIFSNFQTFWTSGACHWVAICIRYWASYFRRKYWQKRVSTIDLIVRLACFYYNTKIINSHKAAELYDRSIKPSTKSKCPTWSPVFGLKFDTHRILATHISGLKRCLHLLLKKIVWFTSSSKLFLCLDMFCWIAISINFDLLFQQDAYKTGKLCSVNLIKLACFCYKAKNNY
jgi:hypothetical protein